MNDAAVAAPQSDFAIAPGVTLRETLDAKGIDLAAFARQTHTSVATLDAILRGLSPITPEMAAQFSRVLGGSSAFWLNGEKRYRAYLEHKTEQGFARALRSRLTIAFAAVMYAMTRWARR